MRLKCHNFCPVLIPFVACAALQTHDVWFLSPTDTCTQFCSLPPPTWTRKRSSRASSSSSSSSSSRTWQKSLSQGCPSVGPEPDSCGRTQLLLEQGQLFDKKGTRTIETFAQQQQQQQQLQTRVCFPFLAFHQPPFCLTGGKYFV